MTPEQLDSWHIWYYPELEKNIDLYTYIKNTVQWYLSEIKVKYPALNIIKLGLIRSAPHARSQYDGFSHRLHSDYPPNVNVLDLPLRPLSFIIALDGFDFMWLPHRMAKRCDIVTETVKQGQMILFSNNCLLAGDQIITMNIVIASLVTFVLLSLTYH